MNTRIPALLCLVLTTATAFAQAPDVSSTPFSLPKGPLSHTTTDVTLRDEARKKDLELRVRVPSGEAPEKGWPVVVFSHGAGGSRTAFGDLLDYLASHGYASIAPTHSDSIELKRRTDPDAAREITTIEGRAKLVRSVSLPERVTDCKTILDHLTAIASLTEAAKGNPLKVNPDRLAIGGHSAGAFTAQLLAGARPRTGLRGMARDSIPEPRFKAALLVSPQGTTSPLLSDESWSRMKMPILVITGSLDSAPVGTGTNETPESRQDPFNKSPGTERGGPPAYLLFIEGATHGSYAGKSTTGLLRESPTTDPALIKECVHTTCLLFLNAELNQAPDARAQLTPANINNTIPQKVRFELK